MNAFDLAPDNQRALEQRAMFTPLGLGELPYRVSSDVKAPFIGLGAAVNDLAMLGVDAVEPSFRQFVAKPIDSVLGTGTSVQDWSAGIRNLTHDAARYLQPNETASWFGKNVLYGLTENVPLFVAGTAAGFGDPLAGAVLVGGVQGNKTMQLMADQGIDPTTAAMMGGLSFAGGVAGAFLPVKAPSIVGSILKTDVSNLTANLATGITSNMAFGATNRGLSSVLLEQRGYNDMAQHYKALDGAAMLGDAVMGAAFSGYGHYMYGKAQGPRVLPGDVDAALIVLKQKQALLDNAPGLPTDPKAAAVHAEAINKALSDLVNGDAVNVGENPGFIRFDENTHATSVRNDIAAAVSEHLDLPRIEVNMNGALPRIPVTLEGGIMGGESFIKIGNDQVPVRYALVDAGTHNATLNIGENQFRNRATPASEAQIAKIAGAPDFNLLNAAPLMDFGAPTMNGQGQIIGGNGRFEGVSRAYAQGTAEGYRQALVKNLETFGIRPEAAAGMNKPILVRVIEADVNTQRAALASNEGAGAKMSAIEQARIDATRIPSLGDLVISESGQIMSGPNHNLIRAWTREMPVTEAAELVDKTSRITARGMQRLQNAVLFKAYGDSPVLERLIESADPGARNVVSALTRAAADAAKAREAMASGDLYADLDITQDLIQAVDKLEQLRSSGEKISDYLNQGELVTSMSLEARKILQFFGNHLRSAKAMGDMLRDYWGRVEEAGNPKQGDMLGGGKPEKGALLDEAISNVQKVEPIESAELPFGAPAQSAETTNANTAAAHLNETGVLVDAEISKLEPQAQTVLRERYQRAAEQKNAFDQSVYEIAQAVGGRIHTAKLKGSQRAVAKAISDYAGDPSKVNDLLRASIEVDSVAQAQAVVGMLGSKFDVLKTGFRDLLDPNKETIDGYRDAKMNVQLDGVVAEIQVHLPQILAAKEQIHNLYVERESLTRAIEARPNKQATAEEAAKIADLNGTMKVVYDRAFEAATSASKSGLEMTAPLRYAESAGNERGGSESQAAQNGMLESGMRPTETGVPSTSRNLTSEGNFTDLTSYGESITKTTDVGNSSTPRDFFDAANIVSERPDLLIPGENGEMVSAAQALAAADAEISIAKRESQGYDAAVACALRG